MYKLSDTIERKFIESIDLDEWEIETDTGWVDISSIHKTIEYDAWEIKTEDGFYLKGADNHIVFDEYYNEIFIKDSQAGMYILTKNGLSIISEVNNLHCKENMFDITVNHENHRYYTNGILSHNTEAVRGFILHYVLFNEQKTIGLLANKGDTAKEILGKIQTAYQHLPKWLQMGIKEFNKNSFVLENGCRVIAAATSSDAVRGYTFHCIILDETAFIENFDEFFASVYPTISSGKKTKVIMISTPKGLNHFYKLWKDSEEGRNSYNRIESIWSDVPGRDEEWRIGTLQALNNDIEKFNQEFNCVTGDTLITIRDKNTGIEATMSIEECIEWL